MVGRLLRDLLLQVCNEEILVQMVDGRGGSLSKERAVLLRCFPERVVIEGASLCLSLQQHLDAASQLSHLVAHLLNLRAQLLDCPLIACLPAHQLVPVLHRLVKEGS